MMNKIRHWDNEKDLNNLRKSLGLSMVSITTTDTVLGFLAPITETGFFNLNALKGSRENKPYLVLIATHDKLHHFVQVEKITSAMRNVIKHCWPGPLTIVFEAHPLLPFYLRSEQGTVALRCPQHKGLLTILQSFEGLFSTSANKSGVAIPQQVKDIEKSLFKKIAYVFVDNDYSEENQPQKNIPSTIIDFSDVMRRKDSSGVVRIVREGAYSVKDLEGFYGSNFEK